LICPQWLTAGRDRFSPLAAIEKPESGSAAFRRNKTVIEDAIAFWPASCPVSFVPAEAVFLPQAA
jgi:hypothetical protein